MRTILIMNRATFLIVVLIMLNTACSSQSNSTTLMKEIGAYKIYIEELPDYQFNTYLIHTISNKKVNPGRIFFSKYVKICNFLNQDSIIILIAASPKMSNPSGSIELTRLKVDTNNIFIIDHFNLFGAINPGGMIRQNNWYCNKEYKIIDQDHLECIENWWMIKSNKTKEYDNLKTTWKIDYPNRTIIKLSETKIE